MNILYNSIYKHDLKKPEKFKSLDQDIECEIAIIGGGFTGLSSAIELAEGGFRKKWRPHFTGLVN